MNGDELCFKSVISYQNFSFGTFHATNIYFANQTQGSVQIYEVQLHTRTLLCKEDLKILLGNLFLSHGNKLVMYIVFLF